MVAFIEDKIGDDDRVCTMHDAHTHVVWGIRSEG